MRNHRIDSQFIAKVISQSGDVASYVLDNCGTILSWNGLAAKLFAYNEDEILGQNESLLFLKNHGTNWDHQNSQNQGWRIRKDGSFFWAQENTYPLLGKDQEVLCYLKIVSDISNQKILDEALKQWIKTYEKADWGVAISRLDELYISELNPAFAKIHGYQYDEMKNIHVTAFIAKESLTSIPHHLELLNIKDRHVFEAIHQRKDGSKFSAHVDLVVIKDENGNPMYRVAHIREII